MHLHQLNLDVRIPKKMTAEDLGGRCKCLGSIVREGRGYTGGKALQKKKEVSGRWEGFRLVGLGF
jgi:hypothetical protein